MLPAASQSFSYRRRCSLSADIRDQATAPPELNKERVAKLAAKTERFFNQTEEEVKKQDPRGTSHHSSVTAILIVLQHVCANSLTPLIAVAMARSTMLSSGRCGLCGSFAPSHRSPNALLSYVAPWAARSRWSRPRRA